RPRFKDEYTIQPEEVEKVIRAHLKDPNCPCTAKFIPGFIVLKILPKDQHFWSPQLSLSFEENVESGKTTIRGLYGPNPTVWAIFTFGYGAVSISALFLGLYGFSQYWLNQDASILWFIPFFGLAALILYLVAQFGQKLGVEQTFALHHFFEESVGHRIHIT
ncbi:MAG: hypothetical protein ACPGD8_02845, partial [Flavobacteriales bacterium]